MQFDPSKHNTKPVESPAPKAGLTFDPTKFKTAAVNPAADTSTTFNPAKARELIAAKKKEKVHAKAVAKDPSILERPEQLGPVKAWSFSTLKKYEQCPYSVYLNKVEKIPDVAGPAAERGTMIHDQAEAYVRDGGDLPTALHKFKSDFERLHERFQQQPYLMTMEENWGFTSQWTPTGWAEADTWCRQKLDVFYMDGKNSAVIIDHKTGKKFGNELKHGEQGLHYAIGAFMKYPELDLITTEFWYIDHGEKLRKTLPRERALIHLPKIHQRAVIMTTAEHFPPKPTKQNCKWCSYRTSGDCEYAVEDF